MQILTFSLGKKTIELYFNKISFQDDETIFKGGWSIPKEKINSLMNLDTKLLDILKSKLF